MKNIIGVDVGGTNTDAVLLSGGKIVKRIKQPTTPDIESGVISALAEVKTNEPLERVHVGTTAFTNALVERRDIEPSAALRIGAPVSESLPPMIDWPEDLRAAAPNPIFFAKGGREYNGRAINPLDLGAIRRIAAELDESGVTQVAVTSVFGTSFPEDELNAAECLRAANPGLGISLSHRIGRFGILERENATSLNAMLRPLASRTIDAYRAAVSAPLFISQNDGTAMSADKSGDLPIFTVASGPTNSLRGAAMLTGLTDAIIFDVGGTTTDVGLIRNGFPQVAGLELEVAGVRTNFRMPDLCSIGIGGGSVVDRKTGETGPQSVGYRLTEEALVFGGSILTLTDIAVAAGRVDIGDRSYVSDIDPGLIATVDERCRERFGRLVEAFEKAGQRLPIVLVGGGASLVEHLFEDRGREVLRPENADVANAIGASIGQIGGQANMTFSVNSVSRTEALARAESEARRLAEEAGARPDSIRTIELEDAALSYLASEALHVRARVVGELEVTK